MIFAQLLNNYFGWRHGRSEANELGLIASSLSLAGNAYGLVSGGRDQAQKTIAAAARDLALDQMTIIYSSPLLRARQTAAIGRAALAAQPIRVATRLRERFFGDLDGQADSHYAQVWKRDELDPSDTTENVESVLAVARRTASFVAHCERTYHEANILLVSHGDTLQILRTAFTGQNPALHRHGTHVDTGQLVTFYRR